MKYLALVFFAWHCSADFNANKPDSNLACETATNSTGNAGDTVPCSISWTIENRGGETEAVYLQLICDTNEMGDCANWVGSGASQGGVGQKMNGASTVVCEGGVNGECFECILDKTAAQSGVNATIALTCVALTAGNTNLIPGTAGVICVNGQLQFSYGRYIAAIGTAAQSSQFISSGQDFVIAFGETPLATSYHGATQRFAKLEKNFNVDTDSRNCRTAALCDVPPNCVCPPLDGFTLHNDTAPHTNPPQSDCTLFITSPAECKALCLNETTNCNAFSYMWPNHRCCLSLDSSGSMFCPNEIKPQPVTCVYCNDNHGGGAGDPIIYGFDGGWFHFMGLKNHVFNLLSDTHFQLNSKFIHDPTIPDDLTWMGDLGILIGTDEIIFLLDGTVTLNGNKMANGIYLLLDGGKITVWEEALAIEIKHYEMYLKILPYPTPHFNVHVDYSSGPGSQPHGVIGQTSDGVKRLQAAEDPVVLASYYAGGARVCQGINGEGCIDGVYTDYEVTGLLGTDFKFNKFQARRTSFTPRNLLPYEHTKPHIFDDHPFDTGEGDGIIGGTADSPRENPDEL